jgi:hypothetical protein
MEHTRRPASQGCRFNRHPFVLSGDRAGGEVGWQARSRLGLLPTRSRVIEGKPPQSSSEICRIAGCVAERREIAPSRETDGQLDVAAVPPQGAQSITASCCYVAPAPTVMSWHRKLSYGKFAEFGKGPWPTSPAPIIIGSPFDPRTRAATMSFSPSCCQRSVWSCWLENIFRTEAGDSTDP